MPPADTEYPVLEFADADAWTAWLEANHAGARGVWVRLAKKASGLRSVSYADAVEAALCFGWIDGQKKRWDEESSIQKFTPRGKRSLWSKLNRERVERLVEEGRMREAGQAAVDAAKADGRWARAYDPPATATVPADLREALDRSPRAKAMFETLRRGDRYQVLLRVQTAVKPETRARRIADVVEKLARGETVRP